MYVDHDPFSLILLQKSSHTLYCFSDKYKATNTQLKLPTGCIYTHKNMVSLHHNNKSEMSFFIPLISVPADIFRLDRSQNLGLVHAQCHQWCIFQIRENKKGVGMLTRPSSVLRYTTRFGRRCWEFLPKQRKLIKKTVYLQHKNKRR